MRAQRGAAGCLPRTLPRTGESPAHERTAGELQSMFNRPFGLALSTECEIAGVGKATIAAAPNGIP
jgi:hypothetical protein